MIRTRHELAEKIRQITREIAVKREKNKKWGTLNHVDTKAEAKIAEQILLSSEQQTLKPILFFQPLVVSQRKYNHNITIFVYTMPMVSDGKDKSSESVASQPLPNQTLKIKRKRRRSTTYSRVEELLNRGRGTLVSPNPSEESISVEEEAEDMHEVQQKTIYGLSDDILQNVFWYFSLRERCTILSRVCKTWNSILKNPVFWTRLEFEGDNVSTPVMVRLIHTSPLLKCLKLTQVSDASVILQELCRDKPELKELTLRYCSMNRIDCVHVLLQVPSSFPHLEVLDLEGTEFQSNRFFADICLLSDLKSLNLGANRYIHARDLMTISLNCRGLKTLKILNIPYNVSNINRMKDSNFSFILSRLEHSLIHLEYDMQHLGNEAYLAILRCKNLQNLCLTNCLFLTGKIFQKFSQLTELQSLTLTRAICLTSKDFEDLFAEGHLQNIERFDISGCWQIDGTGLEAIAKGLPMLKELSLEKCKSICGHDIHRVSLCKNLSTLNIAHSSITSEDLPLIVIGARRLRSLTIDETMYRAGPIVDVTTISPELKIEIRT